MANITITVPTPDVPEVLAAVEPTWRKDAQTLFPGYDGFTDAQKLRACVAAFLRVHTKNRRREAAERAVIVVEPDVT